MSSHLVCFFQLLQVQLQEKKGEIENVLGEKLPRVKTKFPKSTPPSEIGAGASVGRWETRIGLDRSDGIGTVRRLSEGLT